MYGVVESSILQSGISFSCFPGGPKAFNWGLTTFASKCVAPPAVVSLT
jgi:hypothetical protein